LILPGFELRLHGRPACEANKNCSKVEIISIEKTGQDRITEEGRLTEQDRKTEQDKTGHTGQQDRRRQDTGQYSSG
jgi:hypothetical protein